MLGSAGKLRVFRSDGTLVDSIDVSTAPSSTDTQTLIPAPILRSMPWAPAPCPMAAPASVWYRPVSIVGNTATIRLHNNKLSPATNYYVTLDSGLLVGTINGDAFNGIGPGAWSFTTKAAPLSNTAVRVSATEPGADFRTVQGALNWIMARCYSSVSANGCNTVAQPQDHHRGRRPLP